MAFTKKICPVCGQPIKGIFNLKIKDKTVICDHCSSQICMEPSMIPFQNVEDIKKHIEYRTKNKEEYSNFNISAEIRAGAALFRADFEKKLWYSTLEKKPRNPPLYRFDEIVDYEFTEDGEVVTKGGLGNAVAGGLLFGVAGAVIGGITSKRTSKKEISSMKVTISLSNPYHSMVSTEFIPSGLTYKVDEPMYKFYKQQVDSLVSFIQNIQTRAKSTNNSDIVSQSIADEILKFKNLLDIGAITQDEYEEKKKQLLEM